MKRIPQVETAKALMNEAKKWSVVKWLREKKTVRRTADEANAALDHLSIQLQQRWPDNLRAAYDALAPQTKGVKPKNGAAGAAAKEIALAKELKDADEEAYSARMNAEATFDEAERKLSTRLAREGCEKAILSWELKEEALRRSASICP